MQPYVFPYIGYFQLVKAVDTFVFYDDVNFINRGWINRNRILLNGEAHRITIPCIKPSQNKLINETEVNVEHPNFDKLLVTLAMAYKKAPHFDEVMPLVERCFRKEPQMISDMAAESITAVSDYLELNVAFKTSSKEDYGNTELQRADRLIDTVKKEGMTDYVNAIGGQDIYTKEYFADRGVKLSFLEPSLPEYRQFGGSPFASGLSIIDALMFLDKQGVVDMLGRYKLV